MTHFLKNNLIASFLTSPFKAPLKAWALVPVFILFAMTVGFSSGLLQLQILDAAITPFLPLTLFIFPSLLEEAFFRGILIPRNVLQRGIAKTVLAIIISTILFVAWHPLNALMINPTAVTLFLDPWFLVIVTALGLTCGYSYVVSRSIWVPVIIHWLTVTVWVLLLGGRNLLLEL